MTIQLLIVPYFVCREKRKSSFYNYYSKNGLFVVFTAKRPLFLSTESLFTTLVGRSQSSVACFLAGLALGEC